MRKLAVVFPGIGYHTDKPLLYYSKKLASSYGYEILDVEYGRLPENVKGSEEKMREAFTRAMEHVSSLLKEQELASCGRLLFLEKSLGTVVAAAYAAKQGLAPAHVIYTPVEATFAAPIEKGIVFHGTDDSWVDTEVVKQKCREMGLPLYLTEGANHSLETGNVQTDLHNLTGIMERTEAFIRDCT